MKSVFDKIQLKAKLSITVATITAAAVLVPTSATAATQTTSHSLVAVGPVSSAVGHAGVPAVGLSSAPAASQSFRDVQTRIPVGPIINWIKNNAGYIWNAMVTAVRNGWNAFLRWWNGLASWIRNAINFFVSGALWDLFIALRQHFFGW